MSRSDVEPSRPLFRFDPGWLFILAGLSVCAAGVILPAQSDLHALRLQLDQLKESETRSCARLRAYAGFLDQVEREEPDLVRRLAASQLNMIPTGETPVLLAASHTPPITQWIDGTVHVESAAVKPLPVSALSRLANGPDRLWLFAGGIMCVFIGLLLGQGIVRNGRRRNEANDVAPDAADFGSMDDGSDDLSGDGLDVRAIKSSVRALRVHAQGNDARESDDELADDDQPLTPEHVWSHRLVEIPPTQTIEAKVIPITTGATRTGIEHADDDSASARKSPAAKPKSGIRSTESAQPAASKRGSPESKRSRTGKNSRGSGVKGDAAKPRRPTCLSMDQSARIDDDEVDSDPEDEALSESATDRNPGWPLHEPADESRSRNRFEQFRAELEGGGESANDEGEDSRD